MAAISCSIFTYRLITELHPKPGIYYAKLLGQKVVRLIRVYWTHGEHPGPIASNYHSF